MRFAAYFSNQRYEYATNNTKMTLRAYKTFAISISTGIIEVLD